MNKLFTPRMLGSIVLFILTVTLVPWLLDGNKHYSYTHEKFTMPSGLSPALVEENITKDDIATDDIANINKTDTKTPQKTLPHNTLTDVDILVQKPDVSFSIAAPAWVLQVASFVNKDAILKLRDNLRLAGFRTYVRKVYSQNAQMVVYKAYVGPSFNATHLEQQIPILQQWQLSPKLINFVTDIEANL